MMKQRKGLTAPRKSELKKTSSWATVGPVTDKHQASLVMPNPDPLLYTTLTIMMDSYIPQSILIFQIIVKEMVLNRLNLIWTFFLVTYLIWYPIRIHHESEIRIEKSVTRITDWHHDACLVITNGDIEGHIFLSYPHTNNRYCYMTISRSKLAYKAK